MSKSNNQSNFLESIEFVRDISPEVAAGYSGGAGRLNGAANDPDVILFDGKDGQMKSINLNAATGDGLSNIGTRDGNGGGGDNGFNDEVSSLSILRGRWQFFTDSGFKGQTTGALEPGFYNLGANDNIITSALRVG